MIIQFLKTYQLTRAVEIRLVLLLRKKEFGRNENTIGSLELSCIITSFNVNAQYRVAKSISSLPNYVVLTLILGRRPVPRKSTSFASDVSIILARL